MITKQIAAEVASIDIAQLPGLTEIPMDSSAMAPARVFTSGRDARGRFANPWRRVALCVTARGHWFRSDDEPDAFTNDTQCRGCGRTGHFTYILDYKPCTAPASAESILATIGGAR